MPKLKNFSNMESEVESKPETYLYLTKTQWIYLAITTSMLLAAYFGYTGGIPFRRTFYWESDSDESSSSGSSQGGGDIPTHTIINRERPKSWITSIIEKINPFNWGTRTETPQILVHQLPVPTVPTDPVEREAFVSERLSRKWASIYGRLDDEEILDLNLNPGSGDETSFLSDEQLRMILILLETNNYKDMVN